MKKILALSVLAAAASAACAQSSVTIYGSLDAGVSRVSGVKGGTVNQVVSGMMDGSRLGFRGNEDLGGGWRAIFTAESRLEADTGGISNRPPSGSQLPDRVSTPAALGISSLPGVPAQLIPTIIAQTANGLGSLVGVNLAGGGAFWDRQVFVGLVTPVGAILAGRQYTPAYEMIGTFDILQTQSSLAIGQVASFLPSVDIRQSNAPAYRIQTGGITASAMVAAGEGSTSQGRFYGLMGMYKGNGFSVGVGYNTRENERGAKSLTTTAFGVNADLLGGTFGVSYYTAVDDNVSGLSGIAAGLTSQIGALNAATVQSAFNNGLKQDFAVMQIGYRFTTGPHTIYTAYNRADDKRPANADTSSYGAVYSYALSKRTDISASATRFVNSANAQAAPGAGGYLGGFTSSAGVDSTALGLGIRHRF